MRTLIFLTLLSVPAAAQSFNMDVGSNLIIYPTPPATYAAGANQTGFWNAVNPTPSGGQYYVNTLSALDGSPTTATTSSNQGGWYNYFPSTLTGDDRAYMVDIQTSPAIGGPWTWTFSGLQNGNYELYTYGWRPENDGFTTTVTVPGSLEGALVVGGLWSGGAHVQGVTYCVHHLTVTTGTFSLTVQGQGTHDATVNGFQFVLDNGTPFCLGDGTATACPCGNNGASGNGCANSAFAAGGHLAASGNAGASAGTDTLVLTATNVPGPGLFFQASGLGGPILFGDGHLCATSGIIRLGVVFPTGSMASYPGGLTPNPIHIAGGTANGDVRHYQCWYRDAITFCTTDTFNLTNGLTLTWGP